MPPIPHDPGRLDAGVLTAAEALLQAASPGPWQWEVAHGRVVALHAGPWSQPLLDSVRFGLSSALRVRQGGEDVHMGPGLPQHPDLRLIAEARALLPVLLAEVRRTHAMLDDQAKEIRRLERMLGTGTSMEFVASACGGLTTR